MNRFKNLNAVLKKENSMLVE